MRCLVLALALLLCPGFAGTALGEPVPLRVGIVTTPGTAQYVVAHEFKSLLEERAPGAFRVDILHSGALGSETDILLRMALNDVQVAVVTSAVYEAFVPETAVVDFPYLFADYGEVDRVLDGPEGAAVLASLARAGFQGLAFAENGFRHLTNNLRPVRSAADAQGLRLRVMQSTAHLEYWRAVGARPEPLPWPITGQLRSGAVDGQENPLSVIRAYDMPAVQRHLTLTGHVYSSHIVAAGLAWFGSLPSDTRDLLRECAREAARRERAWNRANQERFLREIKDAGMLVEESPDLKGFQGAVDGLLAQPPYSLPRVRALLDRVREAARRKP